MLKGPKIEEENALTFFREDKTLPLKVKIEIDQWIKNIIYQAGESPQKLLRYAYDVEEVTVEDEDETRKVKVISKRLTQLTAHVIFDFLKQNGIEEDIVKLKEFSHFLMKGILKKTQEDLESRPELGFGNANQQQAA